MASSTEFSRAAYATVDLFEQSSVGPERTNIAMRLLATRQDTTSVMPMVGEKDL